MDSIRSTNVTGTSIKTSGAPPTGPADKAVALPTDQVEVGTAGLGLQVSSGSTLSVASPTFASSTTAPPLPPPPSPNSHAPAPVSAPPASDQGWNISGGQSAPPPRVTPTPTPPPPPAAGRLHPLVASVLGETMAAKVSNRLNQVLTPLTSNRPAPSPNPSPQDVRATMLFQQRQAATSNVVPHGPASSIPERGASADPVYRGLTDYAKQNGSPDGTPITARSSYGEDNLHWGQAREATSNAAQTFVNTRSNQQLTSPQEEQVLARLDAEALKAGFQPGSTPDLLNRQNLLQGVYDRGELPTGTAIHQAFGNFTQCLQMQSRTEADIYHKWAQFRPPNAAPPRLSPLQQPVYASSPFAPTGATPPPLPTSRNTLAERGASADPTYRNLAAFAQQHGSLDGTAITPTSNYQQDQANFNGARQATMNAAQNFVNARGRQASPRDEQILRQLDAQCDQQSAAQGFQRLSTPDLLIRRDAAQRAFDQGVLAQGTPVHQAFGAFSQALDMQAKTEANAYHKYASMRPAGTPPPQLSPQQQAYYAASPFAPHGSPPAAATPPPPQPATAPPPPGAAPPPPPAAPSNRISADSTPEQDQALLARTQQATQDSLKQLGAIHHGAPDPQRRAMGDAMAAGRPDNYRDLSPTQRLVVDRNSIQSAIDKGALPKDSTLGVAFQEFSAAVDQQVSAEQAAAAKQKVQDSLQQLGDVRRSNDGHARAMAEAMQAGRPAGFEQLPAAERLNIDRNSLQQALGQGRIPRDSALGQAVTNFSAALDQQRALEAPAAPPRPLAGPTVSVVNGDIAKIPADALIAPINAGGMWFGGIDGVIQRCAPDNHFHNQAAAKMPLEDGQTILAKGNGPNSGAFKNVLFVVDEGPKPLSDLVYTALKSADAAGLKTVSIPAIRMGNREGRAEDTVNGMATGVKRFLADNPQSLTGITFAIHQDPQTAAMLQNALGASG